MPYRGMTVVASRFGWLPLSAAYGITLMGRSTLALPRYAKELLRR